MRDTIDMAQEAQISDTTIEFYQQELKAFAELARADEREACLSVIKPNATPMEIAAAIRARGNT
jgi:hypothetical protein